MRKLLIAAVAAFSLGSLGLACEQRTSPEDDSPAARSAAEVAPSPDSEPTSLGDIAPGFDDDALDPLGPRGDGAQGPREPRTDEAARIGAEGERLEIGDANPDWEVVEVDEDAGSADDGSGAAAQPDAAAGARAPSRDAAPSRPGGDRVNFTLEEIQARRAGTVARAGGEVPAGSVVPVRLDQQLSTSSNQPGDAFTATTTQPLLDGAGRVAVPAGALVRGRVLAVEGAEVDGETSMLVLDFESISTGGATYELRGTVVDARPERRKRTATRETAVKVGAGAAAGAILGQILGKDTEGTLIGAAAGAAAGTAIALGTRDVEAVLPAGSAMAIRLDAPLRVALR